MMISNHTRRDKRTDNDTITTNSKRQEQLRGIETQRTQERYTTNKREP